MKAQDLRELRVRLGEQTLAFFSATNTADHAVVGTATFNVTPDKAGRYFDKIQCFCFSEQRLAAGQSVDLPVVFFVDPAMATEKAIAAGVDIDMMSHYYDVELPGLIRSGAVPMAAIDEATASNSVFSRTKRT